MAFSLLRTNKELAEIYRRHSDMVYRVCFTYVKNAVDAEDMVHDTFCKLLETDMSFESAEHEKAWLIRVASNLCKDKLKHWWHRRKDIESCVELASEEKPSASDVLDVILRLPPKYKDIVYSYYYEGYSCAEIADILHISTSSVWVYLHRARNILKKELGGEFYEK